MESSLLYSIHVSRQTTCTATQCIHCTIVVLCMYVSVAVLAASTMKTRCQWALYDILWWLFIETLHSYLLTISFLDELSMDKKSQQRLVFEKTSVYV